MPEPWTRSTWQFVAEAVFAPYWIFSSGKLTKDQAHARMAKKLGLERIDLETDDEATLKRVISVCVRKGDPNETQT